MASATGKASDRFDAATFATAASTQLRVIGALAMREIHTRYGRDNIGYLWLILEPMLLAGVISGLHGAMGGRHGVEITPVPFTVIGYCVFIIFRGIFNRAEGSIEANQPLLYHRSVTIFDILFAKSIIEVAGCLGSLTVLLSFCILIGYADLPARPLYLALALFLMWWISFSLALIVAPVTFGNHTLGRLVHPISYFMMPLSGAFFQMSWAPQPYRDWLSWMPLTSIMEMARHGQFRTAPYDHVHLFYVIAFAAVCTYTGLLLCRRLRRNISL